MMGEELSMAICHTDQCVLLCMHACTCAVLMQPAFSGDSYGDLNVQLYGCLQQHESKTAITVSVNSSIYNLVWIRY